MADTRGSSERQAAIAGDGNGRPMRLIRSRLRNAGLPEAVIYLGPSPAVFHRQPTQTCLATAPVDLRKGLSQGGTVAVPARPLGSGPAPRARLNDFLLLVCPCPLKRGHTLAVGLIDGDAEQARLASLHLASIT